MKKIKKRSFWFLISIVSIYFIATIIVPEKLDKKYNKASLEPPYTVSKEVKELYNSLDFIADMHCDALLWKRDLLKHHKYGLVDIPRMIEANVTLQAFTIVTKAPKKMNFENNTGDTDQITWPYILQRRPINSWFNLTNRALTQCNALHTFEEKSNGKFRIIKSKSDLQQYLVDKSKNTKITAGFLGIEGMHALNGKLENIDKLYNAGVRMMAPVHFFDNKLGGSAHGVSKMGLTDFGRQVIKKMQEKNMIVDIAHSSPKLIDDVLEITTKPIISSHTGVQGTCKTVRNLSDAHIKGIAKSGGLISIAMFKPATCDSTVASTIKAIKYCIDLVGVEYVALGSDFDGAIKIHTDITGLPLYVEEMLAKGFSKEDISKVMGGNVKRFMLKNLPKQ